MIQTVESRSGITQSFHSPTHVLHEAIPFCKTKKLKNTLFSLIAPSLSYTTISRTQSWGPYKSVYHSCYSTRIEDNWVTSQFSWVWIALDTHQPLNTRSKSPEITKGLDCSCRYDFQLHHFFRVTPPFILHVHSRKPPMHPLKSLFYAETSVA